MSAPHLDGAEAENDDDDDAAPVPALSARRALNELSSINNQLSTFQRELARANARLRTVTEEKDRVLGMVVHDLRNPLSVVVANLSLLRDDCRIEALLDIVEMVDDMVASTEAMKTLLSDLLDVVAINAGRLELRRAPADLGALVRASVRRNGFLAGAKGTLVRFVDDRPAGAATEVDVDERRLGQALDNLLSNAIKYAPPGRAIDLTTRILDGGMCAIEVRDQGPGIADADLPKLFTAFGTTGARPTGGETSTGLGLAITKRIVEAHGGTIEIDTKVGAGSTFRVLLPQGPRRD